MTFEKPKSFYTFQGWFKIKSKKGYGFNGVMIHYFYKSKESICGEQIDQANELIRCEDVIYKRCSKCIRILKTYNDLSNKV